MRRHRSGLRHGRPLWLKESERDGTAPAYPRFRGRRTGDVVIVGGGMTGALVALTFAAEGVPVARLESGCVGCGSTLASSALLLQEPDRGLPHLTSRYGRAASRRIWELGRDGVRDLIIVTGYATPHFRPLAGRFRMYRTYVLATRPLNEHERREVARLLFEDWRGDTSPDHQLFRFGRLG